MCGSITSILVIAAEAPPVPPAAGATEKLKLAFMSSPEATAPPAEVGRLITPVPPAFPAPPTPPLPPAPP